MSIRKRGSPLFEIREALSFIWRHPANRGRRLRKIGEALAFQARGRLFGKPTVARIGERSRVIVSPGGGQAGLVYANPVEWPEISCWRRYLRAGDLFVDVGANVGSYSIWAIELGCDVIAIEPDPGARAALVENLALNGYTADVVDAALGDRAGRAAFTTGRGVLNRLAGGEEQGPVAEVEVRTLDQLLGDRTAAGVKVDVEGAEHLVLLGAPRALADGRIRLLQLEWNPSSELYFGEHRASLAQTLKTHGYELFRPDAHGTLTPAYGGVAGPDVFACRVADIESDARLRALMAPRQ